MAIKIQPPKETLSGGKISNAFKSITEVPVDAKKFAKVHNISIFVLRQSKRFNKTDSVIYCKQINKKLMVWRSV